MRSLLLLTAAAAAAATLAAIPANASTDARTTTTTQRQVSGLRSGIAWHRSKTWRLQKLAGVSRSPTNYAERRTTSLPFLRWIDRRWTRRQVLARRLARARPAHWALWNCIHNGAYPGAPHEGNSSTGTYTGPLQMTYPWDGFYVHWYSVPIATVYRDAEIGYRRSGYSTHWLEGQWPNTAPPCLAYS